MDFKKTILTMCFAAFTSVLLVACSSGGGEASSVNMQAPEAQSSSSATIADTPAASDASSNAASSAAEASSSTSSSKEPELASFGEKAEGAVSITLTNKFGKDIKGIALRSTGTAEYGASLIPEGAVFADGEQALVHFPAIAVNAAEESDVELRPTADIRITTTDDAVYEMHQIVLENIKEASLCIAEEIPFLEFTTTDSAETTSTLESERAWRDAKAAEEEAARIAAEEAAAAEAAAAEQAAAEEQYYEEPVYQEPQYQEPQYQEPVYQEPQNQEPIYYDGGAGGGGADQEACIPDIILR